MKKDIFEKVDEIIENHEKSLTDLEAKRAACEREQHQKEKELSEILKAGAAEDNATAYAEAKAASMAAADKVEYYTKKIDELKTADIFDKESRAEYKAEIEKSTEAEAADKLARCEKALTTALAAATEYRSTIQKAEDYCKKMNVRTNYTNELLAAGDRIRKITMEIDRPIFKGN